ncbi:MAG: PilZ domain-containing protein [Pseudomonadota bacterium]
MATAQKTIDATDETRTAPRTSVELEAQLRYGANGRIIGEVHDLSLTGFRFVASAYLPIGARVFLRVGGFRGIAATVVHGRDQTYGCAVERPLYPPTFRALSGALTR